jgi:hypothetical protein
MTTHGNNTNQQHFLITVSDLLRKRHGTRWSRLADLCKSKSIELIENTISKDHQRQSGQHSQAWDGHQGYTHTHTQAPLVEATMGTVLISTHAMKGIGGEC